MMRIRFAVFILVILGAVIGKISSCQPGVPNPEPRPTPEPRYTDVEDKDGDIKFHNGTGIHELDSCYTCSSPCSSTTCCPGSNPQCCRVNGLCGCCNR